MFQVQDELTARGHEVIPFSISYSRNRPSAHSEHFVQPLAGEDAVLFDQHRWTPASFFKTLERAFYSPEVETAVMRLGEETRPDVAYVLHYLRKLSPALLVGLKKLRIPVIVRISDYLMLCPNALCLRNNEPCTLCVTGRLWPSIRYRCVKGSLAASLIHAISFKYHKARGYFDLVDKFVLTNDFMAQMMKDAGWPPDKLQVIPTFTSGTFFAPAAESEKSAPPYILYVGHMEAHKGADILIKAYAEAMQRGGALPRLLVAGGGASAFSVMCRNLADRLGVLPHIDFLDFVPADEMPRLYRRAIFTALPMRSFENLPNTLIESYASGTAVIAPRHGSMRAFVEEGITGLTFQPGDVGSLSDALVELSRDLKRCVELGQNARAYAEEHFTAERHLSALLRLFAECARH